MPRNSTIALSNGRFNPVYSNDRPHPPDPSSVDYLEGVSYDEKDSLELAYPSVRSALYQKCAWRRGEG